MMLGPKEFLAWKKDLCGKKFWSTKILDPKKTIWVKINFGSKKNLCWVQKNFQSKKIFGSKKISGLKEFLIQNFLGPIKMLSPKKCEVKKMLVSKKFWSEKKNLGAKKFWSEKNFSLKKYLAQNFLRCKKN